MTPSIWMSPTFSHEHYQWACPCRLESGYLQDFKRHHLTLAIDESSSLLLFLAI